MWFLLLEHILLEGVPRLTRWVAGAQSWPRTLGLQSCGASSAVALPSTLRTASRVLPAAPTPSNEEAGAGRAEGICPGLQGEAGSLPCQPHVCARMSTLPSPGPSQPSLPVAWSWCPGEEDVVVPRVALDAVLVGNPSVPNQGCF